MKRRYWSGLAIILIAIVTATDTFSQETAAFERLLATSSLRCTFTVGRSVDWDSGKPKVSSDKLGNELVFDAINVRAQTARFIGNIGATDVVALITATGLTLIEETPTGNYQFTTVFASYADGTKDFIAVHSRHADLLGPLPSQFHGTCKRLD